MPVWGIDLGGTKIEGVILESRERPKVIWRQRIPTESDKGYEHILGRIRLLIDYMARKSGLQPGKIGFGTPGSLDPATQTLKNSNTVCLNGKSLKQDLEKKLRIPVAIANDANCFALAETMMGSVKESAPGARVTFGVIMGTGVGGGIVVNGQVINGRQGIGGEWGHNFLDDSGGECYCGRRGCVETILSGKALERFYKAQCGQEKDLKAIFEAFKDGKDPVAVATIDRLIHFFGKAMAVVINILDPDAIILGGGVGNIDELYSRGVKEVMKHVFNPKPDVQFLKPGLGDSAGVFGAAFLI